MNNSFIFAFDKLIDILHQSNKKKYTVFCAALNINGDIISVGTNSYTKTHPMQKKLAQKCGNSNREYLHAEVAALVKCRKQVCSLVVVRMTRTGIVRMARPCPICFQAMKEAGVIKVYYSDNDGNIKYESVH